MGNTKWNGTNHVKSLIGYLVSNRFQIILGVHPFLNADVYSQVAVSKDHHGDRHSSLWSAQLASRQFLLQ